MKRFRLMPVVLPFVILLWMVATSAGSGDDAAVVRADQVQAKGNQSDLAGSSKHARDCVWNIGDPFKMHYPQLPDEDFLTDNATWDVNATAPIFLADDFLCTEEGFIGDIHFWGSWKGDIIGGIEYFVISIHENIPENQNPDGYSKPGPTLWEMEISTQYVNVIPIDPILIQSWYDPSTGEVINNDHALYYQYNICFMEFLEPAEMFYQYKDSIYWLNISAVVSDPIGTQWGWKNSQDHWMDDAVWAEWGSFDWQEIYEPGIYESENTFWIELDDDGQPIPQSTGGTDYYDDGTSVNGWFHYPNTDWWNIWFYDHPFDSVNYKLYDIYFEWYPTDPYYWIEVAANWTTPDWPSGNPPPVPPLTPAEENLYIEREYLELYPPGMQQFNVYIPDYCPEWVSFDIMGQNIIIQAGTAIHRCENGLPMSLDLAFVITALGCSGECGDANNDEMINVADAVWLINYIFAGGYPPLPVLACGDANGDGNVGIQDAVWLINYIFAGGLPPGDCSLGSPSWWDGDCCPFQD